jgi:hypothetical protein
MMRREHVLCSASLRCILAGWCEQVRTVWCRRHTLALACALGVQYYMIITSC